MVIYATIVVKRTNKLGSLEGESLQSFLKRSKS